MKHAHKTNTSLLIGREILPVTVLRHCILCSKVQQKMALVTNSSTFSVVEILVRNPTLFGLVPLTFIGKVVLNSVFVLQKKTCNPQLQITSWDFLIFQCIQFNQFHFWNEISSNLPTHSYSNWLRTNFVLLVFHVLLSKHTVTKETL